MESKKGEVLMATENEGCETSPAVRMKRRQSDARWRANVATCFETLKHVIPMNRRATKRQISKAYVLHEASQHINFLEDILRKLLKEKGNVKGESNPDRYCAEQLEDIKRAFVDKQPDRETWNRVNDKENVHVSNNFKCVDQEAPVSRSYKQESKGKKQTVAHGPSKRTKKKGREKIKRNPRITSVIDKIVHDGPTKTTTVRCIDPCDEGCDVIGYSCAPAITKKSLSQSLTRASSNNENKELSGVTSVKSMVDKVVVNRGLSGTSESQSGLVIGMQYSRIRVNKSKVKKKEPSKSDQVLARNSLKLPVTPKQIPSVQSPISESAKENVCRRQSDSGEWTPDRKTRGDASYSLCSEQGWKNDGFRIWLSPSTGERSSYSPSNASDTSEIFRTQNYITPVKNEDGRSTGFTPVRLPYGASCVFQDWAERDDEVDSAASLICDEDLPLSDGEEDFIESNRLRQGRLKRDIFNGVMIPKRKRCDSERTLCNFSERVSPGNLLELKCRRSLDWNSVISDDETDGSVVDDAVNLLLQNTTSPLTIDSINDSSLSDDLKDLDIIPIDLKTDPVTKLDAYITGQDRTDLSVSDSFSGTTNAFDQIFSGDDFNDRFDSHMSQLDSLQRELRLLEEDPSGSTPVGKISNGCDVDTFY